MKSLQFLDYLVFGLYFIFVIGLALWVSRKPKAKKRTAEDYFLAGRSLPWWIIGASLIASNISTEQIIGMNGTAFESGIAVISYSLIGASITILIVGKYFLPRFLQNKIYSMPEFLEKRYDKRVSTTMSVFWILVYIFVNLTSVISLGAITLNAVLGIPI
jgi:SSS family solute:Na+ symporter